MVRGGDFGEIKLSKSYTWHEQINIFMGSLGATTGFVADCLGLDVSRVIGIGTFFYSVVQYAYVLTHDQDFVQYNVYAYEDKFAYVNDTYQYQSGRTEKLVATCGVSGAAITPKSDRYDGDFFDNNSLMDTGFYNYYNY